ncbi:MAG: hypothetical protein LBJ16_03185 [Holosporaceae bacterium]|nr:hypothetical protein [Holosporaceae bacterium]
MVHEDPSTEATQKLPKERMFRKKPNVGARFFFYVAAAFGGLVLCSCQPRIDSRGNVTLGEKYDLFVEGKTTGRDVLKACGSPSLDRGLTWIYVGHKSEEISFHKPELTDRFVVRLTFDDSGLLVSKEKVDPNCLADMNMDESITVIVRDTEVKSAMDDAGDDQAQRF